MMRNRLALPLLCVALAACADTTVAASGDAAADTGRGDRTRPDGAADTGATDGDAATPGADTGRPDAAADAGGSADASLDTAVPDAIPSDAGGASDTSRPDTSRPDIGGDAGEACISETFEPGAIVRPVDIIWAIDASPSMGDEIDRIEANMGAFAERIGASGLDYRVVVIGSDREQYLPAEAHEFFEICLPEPLSSVATCPDVDGPRYRHVREPIHSRAVLQESLETFDQYRDFLRSDAVKHFVYVTDDDERRASMADDFLALAASDPVMGEYVQVHSIVDFIGYDPGCPFDESLCSCGDARGEVYLGLSEATGGLTTSICQDDWTPIFAALEERVANAVEVPCEFVVPDPGALYEVDYGEVSVRTTGAGAADVPRVDGAGACTAAGGWYFDDPARPTRLLLCPASCGDTGGGLEVELECFRVKV